MPAYTQCPKCHKSGKIPLNYVGLPVRCPECQAKFKAKASTILEYPKAEPFTPPPSDFALAEEDGTPVDGGDLHVPVKRLGRDIPEHIGRFQIRAWVGGGAFGDVYRAFDPVLEREVALKVLHQPKRVEQFLREDKAAARLRHPNIVPVFDSGQDGELYYIATAYIEGRTLANVLADKPPDFRRTADLVRALAEALAYAHDQAILHRDVKPANIMVDEQGQPLLVDFGLAARLEQPLSGERAASVPAVSMDDQAAEFLLAGEPGAAAAGFASPGGEELPPGKKPPAPDAQHPPKNAPPKDFGINLRPDDKELGLGKTGEPSADPKRTPKKTIVGTPGYMAPEQADGQAKAASDQYSLGMVLYELLCGQTAFSGPPRVLLFHAKHTPPPSPRQVNPQVPEDLAAICLKTLAKKPEERYASCQELADDLRRWLEGEAPRARPWPLGERLRHWCRRNPALAVTGGLAALALFIVAILGFALARQRAGLLKQEMVHSSDLKKLNQELGKAGEEIQKQLQKEQKQREKEIRDKYL